LASSAALRAARCSASLAGISDDTSQPTPNATRPAASGLPSVCCRAVPTALWAVSTAPCAAPDTESFADEAAPVTESFADEAAPVTESFADEAAPVTESFAVETPPVTVSLTPPEDWPPCPVP
jgi:hypothetical protein